MMFERHSTLANTQIINYRCDDALKWMVLIGIKSEVLAHPSPLTLQHSSVLFFVAARHEQGCGRDAAVLS